MLIKLFCINIKITIMQEELKQLKNRVALLEDAINRLQEENLSRKNNFIIDSLKTIGCKQFKLIPDERSPQVQ